MIPRDASLSLFLLVQEAKRTGNSLLVLEASLYMPRKCQISELESLFPESKEF